MVFQAFIDDSYTPDGEFVLAGHVATAESWVAFAKEWEELLPFGTIAPNAKFHFKMSKWPRCQSGWNAYPRSGGRYRITLLRSS